VINAILHPYRKPEGAEKIRIGAVKQGVGYKIHIADHNF
jgi:hypothetical protein